MKGEKNKKKRELLLLDEKVESRLEADFKG